MPDVDVGSGEQGKRGQEGHMSKARRAASAAASLAVYTEESPWFIDHSMDTSWSGRGSVCLA
jgi:hypothetical protein